MLTSQRDYFFGVSQFVEVVGPHLHHRYALGPKLCAVRVGASNGIFFHVRELTLYGIGDSTDSFH